jgi:hypothetical protein
MLRIGGEKPYEKTGGKDEKDNRNANKQTPPFAWKIHLITHNDSLSLTRHTCSRGGPRK